MRLFSNYKKGLAESKHALEAELQSVMALPPVADLAAELMPAFRPDGPKPGKSLTLHQLVKWKLGQYEFSSKGLRIIAYGKLETPVREALQVLEHAELVYVTVKAESADNWQATKLGLDALRGGNDTVMQRITERTGGSPAPIAQRLQELERLRTSGVISEAEYATKRQQIINEI